MASKDLSEVFAQAAALADAVPEKYRDRAFELAVRHALGELEARPREEVLKSSQAGAGSDPVPDVSGREPWLARVLGGAPDADVVAANGSRVHQVMFAVIALSRSAQQANTEAVRKYLREKLGITPPSGSHTSDTLKALVPRHLSRDPAQEGRGYVYTPTAKALEVFDDLS